MKRILSVILLLALLVTLAAGCGSEAAPTAQTTAAPTEATEAPTEAPGPSQAAIDALQGKKILFVGNSYSYYGRMVLPFSGSLKQSDRVGDKGLFYQLCRQKGIDVEVTNWTFGSHDLTDSLGESCTLEGRACSGANHLAHLTDPYFDYVALQGYYETEYSGDLAAHLQPFMDFFREANPDVKFLFLVPHMTYVRQFQWRNHLSHLEDVDITVCNWGGMLDDIVYKRVAVPGAEQQYFQGSFVISASEKDGHHQNLLVGYLTTLMVYCAITGESAVGQPYDFCDDSSIHPDFDMEAFREKYYVYEPYTNFVDIYNSPADMNGLQQLIDTYLEKFN